jgi:hypothetical protein
LQGVPAEVGCQDVIPDLIRDPVTFSVPQRHWIAGQARNDNGGG